MFAKRDYTLSTVLSFMKDYLADEDNRHFFDNLKLESLHSDSVRRIALYFALDTGNHKAASVLFASVQKKTEYDILIYTYYLAKNKEYERSEEMLYYFYQNAKFIKKKRVSFDKIAIMIRILEILEKNIELQYFESSYKGELEGKLKRARYSVDDVMSFDHICKT